MQPASFGSTPPSRAGSGGSRSGHARLRVVKIDHRLGDVDRLAVPQHGALRPLLSGVNDHAEAVVLGVLHDHGRHFGQHALRDFILLVAEIFLRILQGAVEGLLLGFDLALQVVESVRIQARLLCACEIRHKVEPSFHRVAPR